MALPTGTITMNDVNIELSRASGSTISLNDTDVRNLAGIASGTISLDNLRGKSAIPSVYNMYNYGTEGAVSVGWSPSGSTRQLFRYQSGNGTWGSGTDNTNTYASNKIIMQNRSFSGMAEVVIRIGFDLSDWEFGNNVDFRAQYSNMKITWRYSYRNQTFYSGYPLLTFENQTNRSASQLRTYRDGTIRQLPFVSSSSGFISAVDTFDYNVGSTSSHTHIYIGWHAYTPTGYRVTATAEILKVEAL